ncbi:MAG: PP2C family serine/threonine-protein phosphatase [Cyanobacteria bacterium P01_G01_bin.49]
MNWKAIARSAIGMSHIKQQMPCQDYGDYKIIDNAIVGVVADGAGSAKYSDVGAKLAVNTILATVTEEDIQTISELCGSDSFNVEKSKSSILKPLSIFSRSNKNSDAAVAVIESNSEPEVKRFFSNIVKQVTIALEKQAETNNYAIDDLACTLLIAIATPKGIAAMQIGDGFITVRYPEREPELLFAPDKGEYINETTFVTSTNALKDMKVVIKAGQPEFICASTDGLERLAIRLSDWTPFSPFFQPLEQYLRETENLKSDKYLEDFLNSDRLNARTDDEIVNDSLASVILNFANEMLLALTGIISTSPL